MLSECPVSYFDSNEPAAVNDSPSTGYFTIAYSTASHFYIEYDDDDDNDDDDGDDKVSLFDAYCK